MTALQIPPAPDSNIDLVELGLTLAPKIPLPKLIADFNKDAGEMVLRSDENTSYKVLAEKLKKYEGKTVKLEPRALEEGALVIELTIVKGYESRPVQASKITVSVQSEQLVVVKVFADRDGYEKVLFDAKELKRRRNSEQ